MKICSYVCLNLEFKCCAIRLDTLSVKIVHNKFIIGHVQKSSVSKDMGELDTSRIQTWIII